MITSTKLNDYVYAPATDKTAMGAVWVVTAPWAHPFWSQYAFSLTDLTTPIGTPPVIHLPGATHEFLLFAIDPDKPVKFWADRPKGCLLSPPNCGYQFIAENNDAALDRIQRCVDRVMHGELSPDTDYRFMWNELFKDGHSLARSMFTDA